MAILRKFKDYVEIALDKVGFAAKKIRQRFELMLTKRNGPDKSKGFRVMRSKHLQKINQRPSDSRIFR